MDVVGQLVPVMERWLMVKTHGLHSVLIGKFICRERLRWVRDSMELYGSERASVGMERELTRDTRQHPETLCVLLRPETMSLVSTWVC